MGPSKYIQRPDFTNGLGVLMDASPMRMHSMSRVTMVTVVTASKGGAHSIIEAVTGISYPVTNHYALPYGNKRYWYQ